MNLASSSTTPQHLHLPDALEAKLAGEGIYPMHLRILISDGKVMDALLRFDQIRRNAHAHMNGDVLTLLGQISDAQKDLIRTMHLSFKHFPPIQKKLQDLTIQQVVMDALSACAL